MKKGLLLLFVLLSAIGLRAQDETTIKLTPTPDGEADIVNVLEVGKTYILGAQYGMCKVSFTAPADGFLSITPSQKVSNTSFQINGKSSTFTKTNGGVEKKGMAKGSVFTGTFYTGGTPSAENVYALVVTFEEGTPYTPLAMTLANPENGGEWSGALKYKSYGTDGVPHFEFSSVIASTVAASVKIGDKVYPDIKCTVDGYNPKLDVAGLPAVLTEAIAAGEIEAGGTFTLTLSGIVDKEFPANTLADQIFTYTLASTVCTKVSPASVTETSSLSTMPSEVVFSFDGEVNINDAKFYFENKSTGQTTELEGATVEGLTVKIPMPSFDGKLLPKRYDVYATGVKDAKGNVLKYGDKEGELRASYRMNNSTFFKATVTPKSYEEVASLKTYTVTLPDEVVYDASLATSTKMTLSKNVTSQGWTVMENIAVSYAISEETPNVITFTLSEEITEPGSYMLEVPQYLFWSKEFYSKEKLSADNCYFMAKLSVSNPIVAYEPESVSPESLSKVSKLGEIVLTFDQAVACGEDAKAVIKKYDYDVDEEIVIVVGEVNIIPDSDDNTKMIIDCGDITELGEYTITISKGAIWTVADNTKSICELVYGYTVAELPSLTLTDGQDFEPWLDYGSYKDVTYTRTVNPVHNYGTICLPFVPNAETLEKYTFYKMTMASTSAITFEEVEVPEAHIPYLYSAKDRTATTHTFIGGETVIKENAEALTVDIDNFDEIESMSEMFGCSMIGSYYADEWPAPDYDPYQFYYAYKPTNEGLDVLVNATKTLTFKAYRAWFMVTDYSSYEDSGDSGIGGWATLRVIVRGVGDNGDGTTGIEEVITLDQIEGAVPAVIYDLMGRPVAQPVKGQIYIVNGKAVVY